MRIPLSWLAEYVDLDPTTSVHDVHAALVQVGFEEEDVHSFDLTGPIVVGQVLDFTPEEQSNGKTIRWCQVRVAPEGQTAADGGAAVHGIVCGASNFVVGDKVVVTLPGAVLPGPFPIAPRKTYGHTSEGMMASAKELGLGEGHEGIIRLAELGLDPEVGTDAIALLGLGDSAVEINVTPDRGYGFSIRGVAREYAHSTGAAFRDPATHLLETGAATVRTEFASEVAVTIADEAPIRGRVGASVFATRVVRGIDATRPTPAWMISRLSLAGVRTISLPVDITNYVMFELGQPIHGYDLGTLAGGPATGLTVRRASAGETLTTLDGVQRSLHPEDLVIAHGSQAIGLAGVMGGASTEISGTTTDVLIEAANFDPVSIARTARRHKLPSEASRRFERGVDPAIAAVAAGRVAQLLVDLAGGTLDETGSYLSTAAAPEAIELPANFVSELIGFPYTPEQVATSLSEIGCAVAPAEAAPAGTLSVTPPSWRPDLTDKWTLAEEVARIVGYQHIPALLPVAPPGRGYTVSQQVRRRVAQSLAANGLTETLSYPFFDEATNNLFGSASGEPVAQVALANALDMSQARMRTSLLPGLLGTAARNRSRGLTDLALFELGSVFRPEPSLSYGHEVFPGGVRPSAEQQAALYSALPPQPLFVAGVLTGDAITRQPGLAPVPFDWQHALDAVRQIALAAGVAVGIEQATHASFHPGRTAALTVTGYEPGAEPATIGYAGELLPAVLEQFHLPRGTVAFELNLDTVSALAGVPHTATAIGTMPAATQDLSLVVPATVPAVQVRGAIVEGAGELLESCELVDVYAGEGLPEGTRSLSFALRFRAADRTLTQAEATEAKQAGVALAAERFGATLRE